MQTKIINDIRIHMKKTCRTCHTSMSVGSFSLDRSTKDGLDIHCRTCKKTTLQALIKNYPKTVIDLNEPKYCYLCKQTRNVSEFYGNRHKKTGISTECGECSRKKNKLRYNKNKSKYLEKMKVIYQEKKHLISAQTKEFRASNPNYFKNRKLKQEFGITLDQYKIILTAQNNVCAICSNPETIIDKRTSKLRSLAVDHCHKTRRVRGLLCMGCNQGLGNFREDITRFNAAAKYLKKFRGDKCRKI